MVFPIRLNCLILNHTYDGKQFANKDVVWIICNEFCMSVILTGMLEFETSLIGRLKGGCLENKLMLLYIELFNFYFHSLLLNCINLKMGQYRSSFINIETPLQIIVNPKIVNLKEMMLLLYCVSIILRLSGKQCRLGSDCSFGSSLIWASTVCIGMPRPVFR